MPTVTQADVTAIGQTYIGAGNVYVNVTKPADMTALVLTAGAPPLEAGGRWVGLTSGPCEVEYKPDVQAVEVEQTLNEIAPRVVKESLQVKFKCALADYKNLRLALQTGTAVDSGSGPTIHKTFFGGKSAITPQCVTVVSPLGGGLYEYFTIYAAYSVEGLRQTYKNAESRMVEVTLVGYADPTRSEGDQLGQLITEEA